jgi:hypothetical protein
LTRRPRAPGRSPLFPQPISSAGPRLPIGLRTAEGGRSLLASLPPVPTLQSARAGV